MKFPKLPNPFKKSSDDDEDDDFEGGFDEDFDAAPAADDGSAATVVMDEDDARPPDDQATGAEAAGAEAPPMGDDEEDGLEMPLLPGGRSIESFKDDDDDGLEMPALPDGRSVTDPDVPDDDVDFDQFDDEFEDQEAAHGRKHLMIIAAGVLVLLGGIVGGVSWWFLGNDDGAETAAAGGTTKGPRVEIGMPAKPGSPNALLAPPPTGTGKTAARLPAAPVGRAEAPLRAAPASPSALTPSAPPALTPSAPPSSPSSPAAPPSPERAAAVAPGGAEPKLARAAGDIGGQFGGHAEPLSGTLNRLGGAGREEGAGIVVPAVTSGTVRAMPDHPGGKPLGPTPDARIVEKKEGLPGPLPIANKDATPWQTYARPFEPEHADWPRVAIVIVGLGMSRAATMSAITKLPPQVTLALDPYARDLNDWTVRARLVGHEVMVQLPMEDERFPVIDAGPLAMDTGVKTEENIIRLEKLLSSLNGYTGVVTHMGSRFGTSEKMMTPVMEALKYRGLLFLAADIQTELAGPKIALRLGMPRVLSDLTLDDEPRADAIDAKLVRLEEKIRQQSRAVAVAHAYPVTLSRLIPWLAKLPSKQIELVPVSALADTTKSAE